MTNTTRKSTIPLPGTIGVVLVAILARLALVYFTRREYPVLTSGGVVVTGASRGIGFHMVQHLANKTDFIVYAGVRKEADAEKIRDLKVPNLLPVRIDVSDEDSVKSAASWVLSDLEKRGLPLAGIVNNAGITGFVALEEASKEEFEKILSVNYYSLYYIFHAFGPALRKAKGRILNVSSVAGFLSGSISGMYSISKFAMEAFSDALRQEMAPFEVSVSVIQPGVVESDMSGNALKAVEDPSIPDTVYKKVYESRFEKVAAFITRIWPPVVVSDAVLDALTNKYPKTRYRVAGMGFMEAEWMSWLVYIAPDRFFD